MDFETRTLSVSRRDRTLLRYSSGLPVRHSRLSGVKKVKLNGLRTNLLFVLAGIIVSGMSPAFAVDQFGWPRFNLNDGQEHCAGKAFAVRWYRNRTLLLLPLHILSPEAEYSHYVAPQDVSKEVRSVDVLDLQQQSVLASSSTSLLKTGCTVGQGTGDLSGDLMAFELSSSSRLTPFNMLGTLAPVGTKVWVWSKDTESRSLSPDRYSGTISASSPSGLVLQMDAPVKAISSSGAPVVNAKNELVGMMVGKQDDRRMVIMAIPSSSLIRRLYSEIGQ